MLDIVDVDTYNVVDMVVVVYMDDAIAVVEVHGQSVCCEF